MQLDGQLWLGAAVGAAVLVGAAAAAAAGGCCRRHCCSVMQMAAHCRERRGALFEASKAGPMVSAVPCTFAFEWKPKKVHWFVLLVEDPGGCSSWG